MLPYYQQEGLSANSLETINVEEDVKEKEPSHMWIWIGIEIEVGAATVENRMKIPKEMNK